jgi:hypothetical protein
VVPLPPPGGAVVAVAPLPLFEEVDVPLVDESPLSEGALEDVEPLPLSEGALEAAEPLPLSEGAVEALEPVPLSEPAVEALEPLPAPPAVSELLGGGDSLTDIVSCPFAPGPIFIFTSDPAGRLPKFSVIVSFDCPDPVVISTDGK